MSHVNEAEPVVLSQEETQRVFNELDRVKGCASRDEEPMKGQRKTDGRYGLAARLQYGAGLRVSELVRLRVQDVDLERGTVTVRGGDPETGDESCAAA